MLVTYMMKSLEANNKLSNGKIKVKGSIGWKELGRNQAWGLVFTGAASVILFTSIFLCRSV